MRIYKTTDKIEVKIDGISFFLSPLSYQQKLSLQMDMNKASNGDLTSAMDAVIKALKMSIKDVKGLKDSEGDYKLSFEDNGEISDSCIDDLLNMPLSNKLSATCSQFLAGVPDKILDQNGVELEGVSVIKVKPGKK